MFALLYVSSAVVWKCGSDTLKAAWCWAEGTRISQGTANVFRLYCCSGRIPKSPCLIWAHLSLFSLASTMSSAPRRIIGLHCRRQTIYWHFASLNNTVCLPAPIHFTVRTIRHNTIRTHIHCLNGHQQTWRTLKWTRISYADACMCTQHRLYSTYDSSKAFVTNTMWNHI